jgi:hypothetical protein
MLIVPRLVFVWNLIQTARGNVRERDELNVAQDEWQIAMVLSGAVIAIGPIAAGTSGTVGPNLATSRGKTLPRKRPDLVVG